MALREALPTDTVRAGGGITMTICVRRDSTTGQGSTSGVVLRSNDARFAPGQQVNVHLLHAGPRTTLAVDGRPARLDDLIPPLPPGVARHLLHLSVEDDLHT